MENLWLKVLMVVCKCFGHKWNSYSVRSSYNFKVCSRCGEKEEK